MNKIRLLIALGILLALIQVWSSRHDMNPDGISYIEIGGKMMRGEWKSALNGYWSPLYPFLIGTALAFDPSPYWEFPVVHAVNFFIFIFAFAAFSFLLSEIVGSQHGEAFIFFANTLFIVTSLRLITLSVVTPDMLLSAFIYLAAALIFRIRRGNTSFWNFIFLGFVLGLGYLTKAPLFPLAFLFLVLAYAVSHNLSRTLIGFLVFGIIAGPYIFFLSQKLEHLTFGESGRLNYIWYTNNVRDHLHWQGDPLGSGTPQNPSRIVLDSPRIYAFGQDNVMYSRWHDPVVANHGLEARFDLEGILENSKTNARIYYEIFFANFAWLMTGLLFLYFMSEKKYIFIKNILQEWILFLPALAGIGMYFFGVVRDRYTAPFILLFWLGIFAGIRFSDSRLLKNFFWSVVVIMLVLVTFTTLPDIKKPTPPMQYEVARGLQKVGLRPMDPIAYLGHNFNGLTAYFAHLADLSIVAEMPSGYDSVFWASDEKTKAGAYKAFQSTGARYLVSEYMPQEKPLPGWQKIGETSYYAYKL